MKIRCPSISRHGVGVTCRLNAGHTGPHKFWASLSGYREKWSDVDGACDLCERGFPVVDGVHPPSQSEGMIPTARCVASRQKRGMRHFKGKT